MFATYNKSLIDSETYKHICALKKSNVNSIVKLPLPEMTSTLKSPKQEKPKPQKKQKVLTSDFQKYYTRGDFPISVSFNGAHRSLKWLVSPSKIELPRYLPLFLLGLVEEEEPYAFIGEQTSIEAINANKEQLEDILPDLILPIKHALDSHNGKIVIRGLKIFQTLLKANKKIAELMIPFYKNLLPAFNKHIHHNLNLGDHTEFSQKKRINISDLMIETLGMLEANGGADAFANIKYIIPLHQSVKSKGK